MSNWPKLDPRMSKELNMCFGCGQKNPIGLKLRFTWDGETATTQFTPTEVHQSWSGIVHGGLMQVLLDEAMSYATEFNGLHCVTAEMQARLRQPAKIGEPLTITSSVRSQNRKLVKTQATITQHGTVVAEGTATHFVFKHQSFAESRKSLRMDTEIK